MAAAEVPPAGAAQARQLLFLAAGERLALDVDYVREVLPPQELTPVPLAPDAVAGVVNHRGTIVTLVSFARLAGRGAEETGAVVLLRVPGMAVGLSVAGVEGIGSAAVHAAPAAAAPPGSAVAAAGTDAAGRPVRVLDPDVLVDAIYRLQGAGRAAGA